MYNRRNGLGIQITVTQVVMEMLESSNIPIIGRHSTVTASSSRRITLGGSCTRGQERKVSIWLEMMGAMLFQTGDHKGARAV